MKKLTALHAVPGSAVCDSLLLAKIVAVVAAARSLGVAHGGVIQCVHQRKMPNGTINQYCLLA